MEFRKKLNKNTGFTLLEVMVALTITGLAMGSLFSIIAGNKQLAWRAEQALFNSIKTRNLINFSQLNDERGDAAINFNNNDLQLSEGAEFDLPERKTQASQFALRRYEILGQDDEAIVTGSYWVELDLPE